MNHTIRVRRLTFALSLALFSGASASAQSSYGVPALPPPDRQVVLSTAEVQDSNLFLRKILSG